MTLLAGEALNPKRFFTEGEPIAQGSSFDLTIGQVFDPDGRRVEGLFKIKPGHMVQVVSSEVFGLPNTITGHVTYKTTLTKKGIWALTVGIVDPGWNGPVATTLLNFSKVDHLISEGDPFLRVSFFEHDPVPSDRLRRAPPLDDYLKDVRKTAASMFPPTFLNTEDIAQAAGTNVLKRIRIEALAWVAVIVFVLTAAQIIAANMTKPERPNSEVSKKEFETLQSRLDGMQLRLLRPEQASPPGQAPAERAPPAPPPVAEPKSNQ